MMKNRILSMTLLFLLTALWLFPGTVFAAESESINPPGWVGGLLALLALVLAVGTGIWIRNKQL